MDVYEKLHFRPRLSALRPQRKVSLPPGGRCVSSLWALFSFNEMGNSGICPPVLLYLSSKTTMRKAAQMLNVLALHSKIITTVVSTFTAYYLYLWPSHFGPPSSGNSEAPKVDYSNFSISPPMPTFDGRAVLYPSYQNLRDYFSWRQADCGSTFHPDPLRPRVRETL